MFVVHESVPQSIAIMSIGSWHVFLLVYWQKSFYFKARRQEYVKIFSFY